MLKTGCIRMPRRDDDGLRISIMSRHTLNDGITPDRRITPASFDAWWPELAPTASLLGDHYRSYIFSFQRDSLDELIRIARDSTITVLCVETTPRRCHRRLVAEMCREIDPRLRISIG